MSTLLRPRASGPITLQDLLSATEETPDGCLLWTRAKDRKGYGRVGVDGFVWFAHRLAWTLVHGPIPEGMTVDHRCFRTACINVEHLRLLTRGANASNQRKASSDTCIRDHPLVSVRRRDGRLQRVCRECRRQNARMHRQRLRQSAAP